MFMVDRNIIYKYINSSNMIYTQFDRTISYSIKQSLAIDTFINHVKFFDVRDKRCRSINNTKQLVIPKALKELINQQTDLFQLLHNKLKEQFLSVVS